VRRPLTPGIRLAELSQRFAAELVGDGERIIDRLATLESAGPSSLSLLTSARYREAAGATGAGAVIVAPELADALPEAAAQLRSADPYALYARIAQWFAARTGLPAERGRHPSATVAEDARIDDSASIGAGCVIGPGSTIGARVIVGAGCCIGRDTTIGADSLLHPNVTIGDDCSLGERVIVHSGTVIGSDGFGFARSGEQWLKIPQLGGVAIGDDVEIGSNCSIDRGALDDTVIEAGCKLDNLIQVAHNVRIGAGTAIAACVGIAGSTTIGRNCRIGGAAGIDGHLRICDGTTIGAMTAVFASIDEPGVYTGLFPLLAHREWERVAANLRQLPQMRQRLRALEKNQNDKSGQGS